LTGFFGVDNNFVLQDLRVCCFIYWDKLHLSIFKSYVK